MSTTDTCAGRNRNPVQSGTAKLVEIDEVRNGATEEALRSAGGFSRRPSHGSGAPSTARSSTISRGRWKMAAFSTAISHWLCRSCTINAPAISSTAVSNCWPRNRRTWVSPIPRMPAGADLALDVRIPHGPIGFRGEGLLGNRTIFLTTPDGADGELVVHPEEQLALKPLAEGRYVLPAGRTMTLLPKHT